MYRGLTVAAVVPAYKEQEHIADVIRSMPDLVDHIVVVGRRQPRRDGRASPGGRGRAHRRHHPAAEPGRRRGDPRPATGPRSTWAPTSASSWPATGRWTPTTSRRCSTPSLTAVPSSPRPTGSTAVAPSRGCRAPASSATSPCRSSPRRRAATGTSSTRRTATPPSTATPSDRIPWDQIARRYDFENDLLINLNILRVPAVDVPVPARYGAEVSGMKLATRRAADRAPAVPRLLDADLVEVRPAVVLRRRAPALQRAWRSSSSAPSSAAVDHRPHPRVHPSRRAGTVLLCVGAPAQRHPHAALRDAARHPGVGTNPTRAQAGCMTLDERLVASVGDRSPLRSHPSSSRRCRLRRDRGDTADVAALAVDGLTGDPCRRCGAAPCAGAHRLTVEPTTRRQPRAQRRVAAAGHVAAGVVASRRPGSRGRADRDGRRCRARRGAATSRPAAPPKAGRARGGRRAARGLGCPSPARPVRL